MRWQSVEDLEKEKKVAQEEFRRAAGRTMVDEGNPCDTLSDTNRSPMGTICGSALEAWTVGESWEETRLPESECSAVASSSSDEDGNVTEGSGIQCWII